jgi:hypothetical protein
MFASLRLIVAECLQLCQRQQNHDESLSRYSVDA